jgi:hypothetical protein
MDVLAAADERGRRGRQSRVVLAPRRWCQVLWETISQGDGGYKARHSGESAE